MQIYPPVCQPASDDNDGDQQDETENGQAGDKSNCHEVY